MPRFRKATLLFFSCILLCLTFTSVAKADPFTYSVTLSGAQEVPPVASPGTGTAFGTYDSVTNILTLDVTFSGLLSPTNNAHFHCCALPGVNGPVVIGFVPGFPLGVTSGNYINTFGLTPAQGATLLAGLWYINIHTNMFPGGEIRAQINLEAVQAVPEPGTLLLFITGIAGVGGVVRRRRKNVQI